MRKRRYKNDRCYKYNIYKYLIRDYIIKEQIFFNFFKILKSIKNK